MKPLTKILSAAFLTLTVLAAGGCASTHKQEGTGEYVDDSVVTAKVKAALWDAPGLRSGQINVETFKGVVQLSGFVGARSDMERAVQVTKSVAGVKSVKNDMRLK